MPDTITAPSRGEAWLDATVPGWPDRVSLVMLDMADPCNCVLGQVFKDAATATRADNGFDYATDTFGINPRALGFCLPTGHRKRYYTSLTAEWKRLIEQRRAGGQP